MLVLSQFVVLFIAIGLNPTPSCFNSHRHDICIAGAGTKLTAFHWHGVSSDSEQGQHSIQLTGEYSMLAYAIAEGEYSGEGYPAE